MTGKIKVFWNGTDVGIMSIREAFDYVKKNLPALEKGETIELEKV